jgi:hypothetical protein
MFPGPGSLESGGSSGVATDQQRSAVASDSRAANAKIAAGSQAPRGFTAFFLCGDWPAKLKTDFILRLVVDKGFEVLSTRRLSSSDGLGATEFLRQQGFIDCAFDGPTASPAEVMFCHDLIPLAPAPDQLEIAPSCDNARIFAVRNAVRKDAVRFALRDELGGFVATQSAEQAWQFAKRLLENEADRLAAEIADREARFALGPAVRDLSRFACRAKVELVEHEGTLAVRKTFRPGAERFMRRELEVLEELGPVCSEIPRLLAKGQNFFITEFVEIAKERQPAPYPFLIPLRAVRQLAQFVRICLAHGFDPIDLKPVGNVLYSPTGIKVIDYEYWRRCDPGTRPEESYCLVGVPPDFAGDHPRGLDFVFQPYRRKWRPHTGLTLRSFLHDPAWRQHALRSAAFVSRLTLWPALRLRRQLRR